MKKLLVFVLICAVFLVSCGTCETFDSKSVLDALVSENMMGRQAGSRGGSFARDMIRDVFCEMGLDVSVQEFSAPSFSPESFSSELCINGEKLVYMSDFVPARASLPVEISGEGTFDILDSDIGNKIWITEDTSLLKNAAKLPAGIIVKGDIIRYAHSVMTDIPVFCVSDETYALLAKQGVKNISMSIKAEIEEKTMANVIAEIKGKDPSGAVVISAHYDGCGFDAEGVYQSAVDNASGVITMLKAASYICENNAVPCCDIVFCAFDGEESGLFGSAFYASCINYEDVFNINIDCIEKNKNISVMAYDGSMDVAEAAAEYLCCSAGDICGISDDLSFSILGHKAVLISTLTDKDTGSIHTKEDTSDKVDTKKTDAIAKNIAEYVLDIAC